MAIESVMAEVNIPAIVHRLAQTALELGADPSDSRGIVKAICQQLDLDIFAWYAICRELRDMQPKRRHIGFIQEEL